MDIPFPYQPYPQQVTLMRELYDCIDQSQYGIFESPTGTGKSMSAICASLHWLTQAEASAIEKATADAAEQDTTKKTKGVSFNAVAAAATTPGNDGDDWFTSLLNSGTSTGGTKKATGTSTSTSIGDGTAATNTKELANPGKAVKDYNTMKDRIRKAGLREDVPPSTLSASARSLAYGRSQATTGEATGTVTSLRVEPEDRSDDEFGMAIQYDSDQNTRRPKKDPVLSRLLGESSSDESSSDSDEDESSIALPQIIYCSRTHSQISQFVGEIKASPFRDIRCVTLGSRKNMCINESVRQIQSDAAMSERCLELGKSGSIKKSGAAVSAKSPHTGEPLKKVKTAQPPQQQRQQPSGPCPYHKKRDEGDVADKVLSRVRDIEELAALGRKLEVCPYYTSRKAVRDAQVICAPYNVLLHHELRASMGIRLAGNVLIFDEAHNLVDSINHTYSAEVSLKQLTLAEAAIRAYLGRFAAMLNGKNLYYVNVFQSVVSRLLQALAKGAVSSDMENAVPGNSSNHSNSSNMNDSSSSNNCGTVMGTNSFIFYAGLDNINLFKLQKYLEVTRLISRIGGFADHTRSREIAAAAIVSNSTGSSHSNSTGNNSNGNSNTNNNSNGNNATTTSQSQLVPPAVSHISALRSVASLLGCLSNTDSDGRISITFPPTKPLTSIAPVNNSNDVTIHNLKHSKGLNATGSTQPTAAAVQPHIKFVLFNPSRHFRTLIESVRSVVLLGGTMQPFSLVVSSLFQTHTLDKSTQDLSKSPSVRTFSCDHVVSSDRVNATIITEGPSGRRLSLTHDQRTQPATLHDVFSVLIEVAGVTSAGVVVFFTSYAYMETFLAYLRTTSTYYQQLYAKKPIFVEPRSAADGDRVLVRYSQCANNGYGTSSGSGSALGAMLFCVMGGKLSEGINFSDDLARCVVVVGMPYPDMRDPILSERMKYADSSAKLSSLTHSSNSSSQQQQMTPGKRLYEAICMKAVNQSIGRSIRHARDYAAILLLDARYASPRVRDQLPGWIARSLVATERYGEVRPRLEEFFGRLRAVEATAKGALTTSGEKGGDGQCSHLCTGSR